MESNHRHEDFQTSALPTELPLHIEPTFTVMQKPFENCMV